MCRKNIFFGLLPIMLTMNSTNLISNGLSDDRLLKRPDSIHYLRFVINRLLPISEKCNFSGCISKRALCFTCRKYQMAQSRYNILKQALIRDFGMDQVDAYEIKSPYIHKNKK